jgi:dienelactone hydrolase
MEHLPSLIGHVSMQSHLDELAAAVDALAAQPFVDTLRIAGLGNSEGALHVLHYATSGQRVPFVGCVLAAPPGRPIQDVLLSQLALQAAQVPGGAEFMPKVEEAAARYAAGQAMDPDPALPSSVKMVLASFETPMNLPFARELWVESACESLAKVRIATLVLIGGSDLQIDMHADGDPLQRAAAGMTNVTFAFPPHVNHVFKEDHRTPAEVASSPGNGYSATDTHLDPQSLTTILDWLHTTFDSAP